jgi:hypothetical protein
MGGPKLDHQRHGLIQIPKLTSYLTTGHNLSNPQYFCLSSNCLNSGRQNPFPISFEREYPVGLACSSYGMGAEAMKAGRGVAMAVPTDEQKRN